MSEPGRVGLVGRGQGHLALLADRRGGAEVDRRGGVQPDPAVAVLMVVVGEERLAERPGIGQGPERAGKIGAYLRVLKAASL